MSKLVLALVGVLVLPNLAFASIDYSRTPGSVVTDPVNVTVSLGSLSDLDLVEGDWWGIALYDHEFNVVYAPQCVQGTYLSTNFTLGSGFQASVVTTVYGSTESECLTSTNDLQYLEGNGSSVIFTVSN